MHCGIAHNPSITFHTSQLFTGLFVICWWPGPRHMSLCVCMCVFVYAETNTPSHTQTEVAFTSITSLLSFRNTIHTICSCRRWPVTSSLKPFLTTMWMTCTFQVFFAYCIHICLIFIPLYHWPDDSWKVLTFIHSNLKTFKFAHLVLSDYINQISWKG